MKQSKQRKVRVLALRTLLWGVEVLGEQGVEVGPFPLQLLHPSCCVSLYPTSFALALSLYSLPLALSLYLLPCFSLPLALSLFPLPLTSCLPQTSKTLHLFPLILPPAFLSSQEHKNSTRQRILQENLFCPRLRVQERPRLETILFRPRNHSVSALHLEQTLLLKTPETLRTPESLSPQTLRVP